MKKRFDKYDGEEIAHVTADGKSVRADDEMFESVLRDWEQQGVDTDLVHMARPLLDGDAKQQAAGEKFLARARDRYLDPATAQAELLGVLYRNNASMGHVPHVSEADFDDAWDDFSGKPQGKSSGDFSFGHSDASRRQALSEGVNPGD